MKDSKENRPPRDVVAAGLRFAHRRLSAEEFNAYANAPMTEDEREEKSSQIDWFLRRYPTPLERLRYARRAWRNAQRLSPYPDLLARRAWDTDA